MAEGVKDGSARLWSLDALRGFDMLMITGLSGVLINFLAMLGVDKEKTPKFLLCVDIIKINFSRRSLKDTKISTVCR